MRVKMLWMLSVIVLLSTVTPTSAAATGLSFRTAERVAHRIAVRDARDEPGYPQYARLAGFRCHRASARHVVCWYTIKYTQIPTRRPAPTACPRRVDVRLIHGHVRSEFTATGCPKPES